MRQVGHTAQPTSLSADAALLIQCVTRRSHRADDVVVVDLVQSLPQAADMDIDRSEFDIDVMAPYQIEQLLPREDPAGVLHEMAQQAELGRPQMDVAALAATFPGVVATRRTSG